MKPWFAALVMIVSAASPSWADLKYTMHMETKKAEGAAPPANPVLGMMGDALMKQMVPEGAADVVYLVGDKVARIEYQQAAMGQAAGTVDLLKPDGTLIVMNPAEKTYWKMNPDAAASAMKSAGISPPDVTAKRTGQFETVAGSKCEVVTFDWKMAIPIPEAARASLPAGFPTSLTMTGDTCTSDAFPKYAAVVAKAASSLTSAMGWDKIAQGGLILRQRMQMNGYELRAAVTTISEEPASPESAFDVPADFKEVPMPTPIGRAPNH